MIKLDTINNFLFSRRLERDQSFISRFLFPPLSLSSNILLDFLFSKALLEFVSSVGWLLRGEMICCSRASSSLVATLSSIMCLLARCPQHHVSSTILWSFSSVSTTSQDSTISGEMLFLFLLCPPLLFFWLGNKIDWNFVEDTYT